MILGTSCNDLETEAVQINQETWDNWQKFRAAQQALVLPAGAAAHIPVTVRYIDEGEAQLGTILLMHGIPT